MRLGSRVAVVTGSSRGIGCATALLFAREGADVVVNGRNPERIDHVTEKLRAIGRRGLGIPADVTDEEQIQSLVGRTIEAFGRIDILVNNVGGTEPAPHRFLEDYTRETWQKILELNLTSQFLCSKAVIPHMKKQRYGRIINISSIAGVSGTPLLWSPPYCAAKAGVLGLTKQMALELGPYGINVNAIAPVDTATERMSELVSASPWPETAEQAKDRYSTYPLGRMASVGDVAKVALFLAAEDADYITGETILVAGGSYIAP